MRTTKIITFSVPPELERAIKRYAKTEHRTISEYLREAVRRYMDKDPFGSPPKARLAGRKRGKP